MSDSRKNERILSLYTRLIEGQTIFKKNEASKYDVAERTIQRDIEDINRFLEQQNMEGSSYKNRIFFDKAINGHRLEQESNKTLSNSEVLAISKILLESRAFTKQELMPMLNKLLNLCLTQENHRIVSDMIANEKHHYVEPQHKTAINDKLWELGIAVKESRILEIEYQRVKDKSVVNRRLQPVAILFSEYYFYLVAFIDDKKDRYYEGNLDLSPTIYRIDRIQSFRVLDVHFKIPYRDRFEEGEFRKRVQFMYGGHLQTIKFRFKGESVEAVLDRLPTAKIIDETNGIYTITAEVFGTGIDMWLRSQGDLIELF